MSDRTEKSTSGRISMVKVEEGLYVVHAPRSALTGRYVTSK